MIIQRSRRLTFQPQQYESIEISASIQIEEADLHERASEDGVDDAQQWLDDYLTYLLEGEMEEAAKVTTNRKSIVNEYRYTETETETRK